MIQEAADLGSSAAQKELADMYYEGDGVPLDLSKAAYYYTLIHCEDPDPDTMAAYNLGFLFHKGQAGFEKSLWRTKYYFMDAAKRGYEPAYEPLTMVLFEICSAQYRSRFDIPEHSCIPSVLYWGRKAAYSKEYEATKMQSK